jgi:uncharacterized protein (TIGR03643 family)
MKMSKKYNLTSEEIDRIVEMAWEDRTSFDAIERQFGIPEKDVIVLMRQEMKRSSWKMWRKRVQNRPTKHDSTQRKDQSRFKSRMQRIISGNNISKR